MSAAKLIEILDKMCRLHALLYEQAQKKTEVIKENDMNGLDQMLKEEQKFFAAINTMEKQRQLTAQQITGRETATLSDCIERAAGAEKEKLRQLQGQLVELVSQLKYQNELNQKLIYQSLQFVNMNLGLLQPSKPESATYSNPMKQAAKPASRSLFDAGV